MPLLRHASASALLLTVSLGGCTPTDQRAGGDGDVGGTLVISAVAEAQALIPALAAATSTKQVTDQIFDALAEIGPDLNTVGDGGWTPRLASSWEWGADSLSITFHLDPRARWHDGRPVTASDVRFSVELYQDPKVVAYDASNFANVDSISVRDSVTAVAWFRERSPEQFFRFVYYLWVMPEHRLRDIDRAALAQSEFARNPIGSGPFRFVRWEPRQVIELVADSGHYRGRPKLDRVIFSLQRDVTPAMTAVLAGEADFREVIPPDFVAPVAKSPEVRAVPYRSLNYGFLAFNQRARGSDTRPHPLFQSRELRRALAMALDRRAMVQNLFDSTGRLNLGPFTRGIAEADTTLPQIPYDTAAAQQLLDSLGWRDGNGDGVRERQGTSLRFDLLVPTSSTPRRRLAVLLQEQLRRVGAAVDVREADPSATQSLLETGQYDSYIHFVQTSPSAGSIRDGWTRPSPDRRIQNPTQYGNRVVDAVVDSALAELDPVRRRMLLHRAYGLIAEDAPAVWLYEMIPFGVVNKRVRVVADRADTWWRDLRLWWIPAAERIARDRAGT
ncbi:MAG TPA: peptide ABC transporter substrate-binding protein [Gemmatimonadaceae bacterium]|nr:peptide ABC transporter substrate-binding protein [Gemmatimonadaceae bacterium]